MTLIVTEYSCLRIYTTARPGQHNIVGRSVLSRTSEADRATGTVDHGTRPGVVILGLVADEVVAMKR